MSKSVSLLYSRICGILGVSNEQEVKNILESFKDSITTEIDNKFDDNISKEELINFIESGAKDEI